MFAWIDGLWWMDLAAALALGILIGKRWTKVMMQAKCDARTCDTINDMRIELVNEKNGRMKVEAAHDYLRREREKDRATIHSLRTSKGIMGRELTALTYQMPRPQRKMV